MILIDYCLLSKLHEMLFILPRNTKDYHKDTKTSPKLQTTSLILQSYEKDTPASTYPSLACEAWRRWKQQARKLREMQRKPACED